jgi:hypothetical protein
MSDVIADRREAPRFPLILVAEVTDLSSSAQLSARTSDVSRTGCYIDTLNPIPVGSQVRVRLRRGDQMFECSGRVVYICPGLGMGVAWGKTVSSKQLSVLDGWLQEAAAG